MSAILEVGGCIVTQGSEPESGPAIAGMRQFALAQIGSRLTSEPNLVAAFWEEIGAPVNPACPDLTVLYCSLRWMGQTFVLLEFVSGETLEELVKRSDPASCEREIPLFCRLLDAFEGAMRNENGPSVWQPGIELMDFGFGRTMASTTTKLHGAILVGPDGAWTEKIFGDFGASRRDVCALLMELCARLPGNLPRSSAYGPGNLGEYAAGSPGLPNPAQQARPPGRQGGGQPKLAGQDGGLSLCHCRGNSGADISRPTGGGRIARQAEHKRQCGKAAYSPCHGV